MKNLDFEKAKKHFDEVKKNYTDLIGVPGVNPHFALNWVFEPLEQRFASGERTEELFRELMKVE